ncbi:MAG: ATP-binding cassette domain-containing protein [Candidatus Eremiobacteraeota bacterium]|nr:ATP-binding cassette domain-containing protein [Candidatus Eremiobacteraeota bacterium]
MRDLLVSGRGLERTYRTGNETIVALAHADVDVQPGARIALQGPSGSGKSTLLQILGGIETPTAGMIVWPALGTRAQLRPAHVACVFQNPSLVAALSVIENVELPLVMSGVAPEEARARAAAALDAFELAELRDKLPEELSGGQAQRAAFARALCGRPQLVLADEPTGQLDSETADAFLRTALAALDAAGTALVVATHDARVAERMRDRWQMAHGTLRATQ